MAILSTLFLPLAVSHAVPAVWAAEVNADAIAKVEAGAAVTLLGTVQSDASGRAIDHVSGVGDWRLGKALDAASAAGEIIRVQLSRSLDEVT